MLCSVEEGILGISLALMVFTGLCVKMHIFYMCVLGRLYGLILIDTKTYKSSPTFHPNYADHYKQ